MQDPRRMVFVIAGLVSALTGQDGGAAAADPLTPALQLFLSAVTAESSPAAMANATTPVLEALAGQPEQKVLQTLVDSLRASGDWETVRASHCEALLELYRRHRAAKEPQRLVPLVVVLERLAPERPQVKLGVAEVFGAAWAARDVARAVEAIGDLRSLMPSEDDGLADTAAKIAGFVGFLGDAAAGWNGVRTILGYLEQMASSMQGGGAIRVLTADDLVGLRALTELREARARGDQAAAAKLLTELRSLQPKNPALSLLTAEMRASWGDAWSDVEAKKELKRFAELTDPARPVPGANEPWIGWADVSAMLRLLDWQPSFGNRQWSSMRDLRDYAVRLGKEIKPGTEDRLVIAPDRRRLEQQIQRLEQNLPKLEQARDETRDKLARLEQERDAAKGDYDNAGRGRGVIDSKRSDLNAKWQGLVRQCKDASGPAASAAERFDRQCERLALYRARLEQFRN